MNTSVLIAQLIAVVYVFVGLGMLANPKHYQVMIQDFIKSPGMIYIGGIMAVLVGVLIILHHNIWESSWAVVITLIGWIATLKGFMLLVFPESVKWWKSTFKKEDYLAPIGVFVLIFGLFFGYFGYLA